MVYEKICVGVLVEFLKEGGIVPRRLCWGDGQEFQVDKVVIRENSPCHSGEILVQRFTIKISGQERYLYYDKENEIWFVERLI